jgi:fatty acid desaturase
MPRSEEPSFKPEETPEAMARALELELISKRPAWQKAKARRQTWRTLSILFVLIVLLGALLAYFFFVPASNRIGKPPPAATEDGG